MTLSYSGKTASFHHKWHDTPNPEKEPPGLSKVWMLNAQWTDCPIEVVSQVKDLWTVMELGNDRYVYKTDISGLLEITHGGSKVRKLVDVGDGKREWAEAPFVLDYIIQYAREHGLGDEEQFFIHYWW